MRLLKIPAIYWDDFSERSPVDEPSQMPIEVRRSGNRVLVQADAQQLKYLLGDAEFYAADNTDGTPPSVVRGARRVLEICAKDCSVENSL